MEENNGNEEDKKQSIKAEKGIFLGLVVIPYGLTMFIFLIISILIWKLFNNIYELIIVIGFLIFLIIILRIHDNNHIRKKYQRSESK